MKILITGPKGYLAQSLINKSRFKYIYEKNAYNEIIETDINHIERLYDYKYDLIIHNAGIVGTTNCEKSSYTIDVNVSGTAKVVDMAVKKNVPLIYLSTTVIYEPTTEIITEESKINPYTLYGKTKYLGELIVKELMSDYIIIRPCMIFGFNDKHSSINMAITSTNKNKKTIYLDERYKKPYLHVDEFVEGMNIIIESNKKYLGEDFNFAPNEHHSVKEILNYIDSLTKTSYNLIQEGDYLKDHVLSDEKINKLTGWRQKTKLFESIDKVYMDYLQNKKHE